MLNKTIYDNVSSLKYKCLLTSGKQGITGIFSSDKDELLVWKTSKYIDYIIRHEMIILRGLNDLSSWFPHTPIFRGSVYKTPFGTVKNNPFQQKDTKKCIKKDLHLTDFIVGKKNLQEILHSIQYSDQCVFSCIKQVLLSIIILQQKKNFTHYDLHPLNILVENNPKHILDWYLYKIKDKDYIIPTLGNTVKIIDFGYSYSDDIVNNPMWYSLSYTEYGFNTWKFDWLNDFKIFLLSISSELKNSFRSDRNKIIKFNQLVSNLFHPLNVNKTNGWDNDNDKSITETILDEIKNFKIKELQHSKLWCKWYFLIFDMIQSLVIHPPSPTKIDTEEVKTCFRIFIREWIHIENQVSCKDKQLYIFQELIDIARSKRFMYTSNDGRQQAVTLFKKELTEFIDSHLQWFITEKINFEKILCSIYLISRYIEGMIYKHISSKKIDKGKEYNKLSFSQPIQLYEFIDYEINNDDDTILSETSCIKVIDSTKQSTYTIKPKNIELFNKVNNLLKPNVLLK